MHKDVYFIAVHDYETQQVDEIELIQGNYRVSDLFLFFFSILKFV